MEEREGFFRTIWSILTETAGTRGPGLVVVPNEIERPPVNDKKNGDESTQQLKTPKPN